MADTFMLVAHAVDVEIDITPQGPTRTFVPCCNGMENLAEALNETVQQYFFYCQKGFASNYVTGMAPTYTATGRRIIGDPAQDWIFNNARKFGLMTERNTTFRMSRPGTDGKVERITCAVTLGNLTDLGGATTDGSPISYEIRLNGKPTMETITPNSSFTVTSTEGSDAGTTVITTNPAQPVAGSKFVYSYGPTAPEATVGEVLTGWNDLAVGGEYTIPTGNSITVAMVNTATSVVIATGNTTVNVKS
ncbi:MAG: hypothetical protein DBX91_14065 [Subdoligranulum variabile]|uniref:phage tail tube protein n=1 Tax=Gemmiger formicilis TaxID=745368 RepID=UPI000D7AD5F1|nr:MAG: hypothetical protein DBX91_14065 [Subdoligranulum variabile]